MIPHHPALDAKARFFRLTDKHLPPASIRRPMDESVASGDRQEGTVAGNATVSYGPLYRSIQRVDLYPHQKVSFDNWLTYASLSP